MILIQGILINIVSAAINEDREILDELPIISTRKSDNDI